MNTTVAPQTVTVKSDTEDAVAVSLTGGYIRLQSVGYTNRVVMDLDDAILVAKAILAFADASADARYEAWLDQQEVLHAAATSLFPAELSDL